MHSLRWSTTACLVVASVLMPQAASSALAASRGHELPLHLLKAPERVHMDGLLREWSGSSFVRCSYRLRGHTQAHMSVALSYDSRFLYVGARVRDSKIVRTNKASQKEDHARLVLSFPNNRGQYRHIYELDLFPGDPGKVEGVVKRGDGQVVRQATLVEAPTKHGVTFEARIPWNMFPPAASGHLLKIRGSVRYHDANGRSTVGVVSTAPRSRAADMPLLITAPEQALREGLLREKHISAAPSVDRLVDIVGDSAQERVLRYGRYVVVLGPHFRKGREYYWLDLGVDPGKGELPMFEVRDVTGDKKAEIILRKRLHRGEGWREMLQVLSFAGGSVLQPIFEHETGISSPVGSIQNDVRIVSSRAGAKLVFSLADSSGYTVDNYHEPTDQDRAALLVPWGTIKSQTYEWNGRSFAKKGEQTQRPGQSSHARPQTPPAPRAPTADELLDRVLALYRHDHGVAKGDKPTFDFVTDVAGDAHLERVLCFGTDLVIFGKGYRKGLGYVSLSMPQFNSAADIVDVTARDLTGDGHAEVLVRGLQRAEAPEEIGHGAFVREVLFVYHVGSKSVKRVFAAETAVANEGRRIHSLIAFVGADNHGLDIVLQPGRANGWSQSTWPYQQDDAEVSGVQPIILPWTSSPRRFHFDGDRFVRK